MFSIDEFTDIYFNADQLAQLKRGIEEGLDVSLYRMYFG